jgi:ABC-type multidrug transport system ATPase subunit
MGLMLFSGDDGKKRVSALSGGEAARLAFSRLALEQPNVLVLDEPTNHLDLESIEALVAELKRYEGTLIFVSHDRWFVSRLATRVVEITQDGVTDYPGTYEEYVHASGDDHLDADTVVLKARREKRARKKEQNAPPPPDPARQKALAEREIKSLERKRDQLTASIEEAETTIARIDESFCAEGYYEETDPDEVARSERERADLSQQVERAMEEWSGIEEEIERLTREISGAV